MKLLFILFFILKLNFYTREKNIFTYGAPCTTFHHHTYKQIKDTCLLQGYVFEIEESTAPNPLKANIKNGKIHISDLKGNNLNYRVIRYVFSDHSDNRTSSVRTYGDLVSYPVLQILKNAKVNEPFYFEEIIVVDQNKEIQNNYVRPIIIKRISN